MDPASRPTSAPLYIEQYGPVQLPAPAKFRDVSIRSFPLRASYEQIDKIVNQFLNIAPPDVLGFEVKPLKVLGGHTLVYLHVLHYGAMSAKTMPYRDWGYFQQKELFFSIPVFLWKDGFPVQAAVFVPYIFVDNSWSALDGNMVLGYPKMMASFQLPPDVRNPYPFSVETDVFVEYSPLTPLTRERILQANESAPSPGPAPEQFSERELWPFGPIDKLFGSLGPFQVAKQELELLAKAAVLGRHHVIQLKQFRDIASPVAACYQALVGGVMKLAPLSIKGAGFLKPAEIEIFPYASLQICETLGLENQGGTVRPILPFWIECDFSFVDPKNLFVAGGSPPKP
jgi:hypothetical protein